MSVDMGGDKPVTFRSKVRSDEASVTILKGAPCFYNIDGTRNGVDVVSAEGLAAAKQTFFAGITAQAIEPGKYKETFVHGYVPYARVITASRAASTDVWASYSAGALGDVLSIVTATGSIQALTRTGAGSAGILNIFALAETFASATTQASSIGGASLFSISEMKVFVRSL